MAIPISTSRSYLFQAVTTSRERSDDLQRQLATGQRSDTYGGLGLERRQLIEFTAEISQINGYQRGIDQANVRIDVLNETLTQVRDIVSKMRTNALDTNFEVDTEGRTLFQNSAYASFQDVATILNTEAGGRYIYSGRQVLEKPVEPPQTLLEGQGGQDGFFAVADQRREADLGADLRGRVALTQPSASEVNLAEDGTHPFGFKITAVNSSLTGVTVTGPAGAPSALNLDVAANTAVDGESLTISLTLPDGSSRDVKLTARSGAPTEAGEFQIGATADATASNILAALDTEILRQADTELKAASAFAAADNFFNFDDANPPQRVAGPPYNSATGLVDATEADTVFWYQGEISSDDPRQSQTVKVDDYISVEYGARANEEALRTALQNLAVASYDTYNTGDTNAQDRYDAVRERVTSNLSKAPNRQSIDHLLAEVSAASSVIASTSERHESHNSLLTQYSEDIRNADIYEVSAQILDLQTRLQATYQSMATLSQLSLVNYI